MRIEKMTEKHVPAAAEIESENFSCPRSAAAFIQELALPYVKYFAAESEDVLIGYAGVRITAEEAYISNIAVKNEYKRRGAGYALIAAAARQVKKDGCTRMLLEVRASNAPAMSLYEKFGFKKLGIRKRMYDNPSEDGYIFELIL